MKIQNMLRTVAVVFAVWLMVHPAAGQVVVERSKDKVVIAGVTYYMHQVRKGETVYSIAKAYGITVDDITKENPPAESGVNSGQTIRIPASLVHDALPVKTESTTLIHDDARYIYHVMKPGETVYSLSKSFSVSESDIINSNQGIDISKLSVGTELAIPRQQSIAIREKPVQQVTNTELPSSTDKKPDLNSEKPESISLAQAGQQQIPSATATVTQEPPQEKGYFFHKVKSGESLSSISALYGVTLRELKKANRDLRFPQVGDFVRVPGEMPANMREVKTVNPDTVRLHEEIPVEVHKKAEGYTDVSRLKGSLNVAVLLPFYLRDNSVRSEVDSSKVVKGKRSYQITVKEDGWIYPSSFDFVEMYEGILLAADTLRSLGVNISLHAYDINKDTVALCGLIRDRKLKDMDLIIGPVYSHNLAILADYAREEGIPVVSPVPLYDNSLLKDNPYIFLASSTLEVAQQALARKMRSYAGQNFIFVHADTMGVDSDVKRFRKMLHSELGDAMHGEKIRFREFPFYSRSMFNSDSLNRLERAMSDHLTNVFIIASEDLPVISETMIDIHNISKRYDVKVFGYPVMRDLDNLDPRYFFELNLKLFSPYWIDYSRSIVTGFNSRFRQKFLTEPPERSYAWEGYDIAYYFLSGLAVHGKEFIRNPSIHHPELLQTDFDFVSKSPDDGFENNNLYLINFTRDFEVRLDAEGK
jgi:LysM repeat protein